ncbi:hypothetical protein MPSEU_000621400 [Mayamaea pseudoterrestris]|nr:hypothetical protein MPSEU_000621400 [Mayamaea pseudoterrestris]
MTNSPKSDQQLTRSTIDIDQPSLECLLRQGLVRSVNGASVAAATTTNPRICNLEEDLSDDLACFCVASCMCQSMIHFSPAMRTKHIIETSLAILDSELPAPAPLLPSRRQQPHRREDENSHPSN